MNDRSGSHSSSGAKTDHLRFEAAVAADDSIPDGYMKHYVDIPAAVVDCFPGIKRLHGSIDGTPFSRAVFVSDDGELRLRFGRDWLRDAGLAPGDMVTIQLDEDQDPDRVDVPEELAFLLDENPTAEHIWGELTSGRKRSLMYGVQRAKRAETRRRRARSVVDGLLTEFGVE